MKNHCPECGSDELTMLEDKGCWEGKYLIVVGCNECLTKWQERATHDELYTWMFYDVQ